MKKTWKLNFLFSIILMLTTFIISSCVLTITEVHQPETGYTNNKVVTTIRTDFTQTGSAYYTLSILLPLDWEVANNEIEYKISSSDYIYGLEYNATNSASITTEQVPPTGYYWWSGNSETSTVVTGEKAVAYVVFNTGNNTGSYNLRYHIGDSQNQQLSQFTSGDKAITLTTSPQTALLSGGRVFPELNSNPWDLHSFEVMYNSPSRTIPTTSKLYLDDVAYDMELVAGSYHNGKFSLDFDLIEKGLHEYYFLFDNTLRYPVGTDNLEFTINDYDVYPIPLTETFEINSPSWNDWELQGDWQMTAPEGFNGDPDTAYEGDMIVGTKIVYDGFTTPNTTSILKSPVFDAREDNSVILSYYHHSQINALSNLTIKVEILPLGLETEVETISDISTFAWEEKTINISEAAAGRLFRVIFEFNAGNEACAGTSIDLVSFDVTAFYDAELKFIEESLVADRGESVEYLFTIDNLGTDVDLYDLSIPGSPDFTYALQQRDEEDNWNAINFTGIQVEASESASLKLIATIPTDTELEFEEITFDLNSINGVYDLKTLITRVRPMVLGNDDFGYVMFSSDYSDLAEFNWIPTTTATSLIEDDFLQATMLQLGFNFNYYGSIFDAIYLTPYGGASFFNNSNFSVVENIPADDGKDAIIGLFFDELGFGYGGEAYYEQTTIDDQAAFVLTFDQCYTISSRFESFTAQLILFQDGNIKFQYGALPENYENGYPIVGIEDLNGTDGINFQTNYNALKENYALLFSTDFVANNPQPEIYTTALVTTNLSWTTTGDFASMKVYLREYDNNFEESNLVYSGLPTNTLLNNQIPLMNENSFYYWRVVGVTSEGYEIASRNYEFYTVGTAIASGTVTDSYTGQPIEGVLVTTMNMEGGEFRNSRESVLTDANGYWEIELMANSYYLEFSKNGYITESYVYMDVSSDNSIDIEMNRIVAVNPNPESNAFNVDPGIILSWTNPDGYNYVTVELATNEDMDEAIVIYQGDLIDYASSNSILPGSFYYWRVTLSIDNSTNFAVGNVWRFMTTYPETVPIPNYQAEFPNFYFYQTTKANSGYLVAGGNTSSYKQVLKLDEAGNMDWQNDYTMNYSIFKKAIELDNGNYLVIRKEDTGYLYGEETGVTEVNSAGNIVWNKSYKYYQGNSYSNEDVADGIVDSAGNIVICGSTGFGEWDFLLTKTAFNATNPIWQRKYGNEGAQEKLNSIVESVNSGYILAGYRAGTGTSSIGNSRVVVKKVDYNGNHVWEYEEGFGNSNGDYSSRAFKAIELSDGSILIAGNLFNESSQFELNQALLIKLSAQGNKLWHKTYPIKNYGRALDVTTDNDGNIYLVGAPDAMKLDSNGNIRWIFEDDYDNVGGFFTNIILTEAGFTISGGSRIAIFGDNTTGLLDTPQNLNIAINGDQVDLSWESVTGATSYRIESSTEADGTYGYEATSLTNSWSGAYSGVRKFYKVRAEN
ncbi:carboxypeptidase regulatory-like domain-containing protein [bacterium]|nr:carboxypeptidase regulatory-like domain-containing protein [bacterium]